MWKNRPSLNMHVQKKIRINNNNDNDNNAIIYKSKQNKHGNTEICIL
jgi:hypothetical protein